MNKNKENLVLLTLSFFEPMTLSQIILDFDNDLLMNFPNFNKEQLLIILKNLEQKKQLKKVLIDKEDGWIKLTPCLQRETSKRSWFKKLFY